MNVKRYVGKTAREVLRLVREDLGGDAIVLSNRSVDGGIEITALPASEMAAEAPAPAAFPAAFANAPRVERDEDFTVSLSGESRKAAPARPAAGGERTARPWQPAASPQPARSRPGKQAPAAPVAAPVADEARLLRELAGIKGLIEQQLVGFAWQGLTQEAPAKTQQMTGLLDAGFSAQLARRLIDGLPADADAATGRALLRGALDRGLLTAAAGDEIVDAGGVYALVGPTGVGKTTTTAKLAARAVVRYGAESVTLLTTDGYRIGAHEQLRIYGRILGVQVHAVRDAAELRRTLAELGGKHLVLIDTIGMSQRDRMVAEQAAMLDSVGGVQRLLLLNATSRGDTLDDVLRAYGGESCGSALAGAILSKVDEAVSLAPALDALIRHRLMLYYVANGQRVPEDLHLPNRAYLLHRALKVQPEDSPHHLEGAEAGLLLAAAAMRGGQPLGSLHG
ncbi:MAG TPA: flagellar biosynthesis protein FlhF [Candidatus Desulfobacillus sp.]|nr:flagellar biosynthesis protein FlhF [Candidatus Desulfobacillus sp.]